MFKLDTWTHPTTGDTRIYINGTTRRSIYLTKRDDETVGWSSKANDTPRKYRAGNHYQKVRKDGDAVKQVCDEFGIEIRSTSFERALEIANGPQVTQC